MEGRDMHYSIVIEWEPKDALYVATIPELAGCVTHGKTYNEAVTNAQDAIDSWIMAAQDDSEVLPTPHLYTLDEVTA